MSEYSESSRSGKKCCVGLGVVVVLLGAAGTALYMTGVLPKLLNQVKNGTDQEQAEKLNSTNPNEADSKTTNLNATSSNTEDNASKNRGSSSAVGVLATESVTAAPAQQPQTVSEQAMQTAEDIKEEVQASCCSSCCRCFCCYVGWMAIFSTIEGVYFCIMGSPQAHPKAVVSGAQWVADLPESLTEDLQEALYAIYDKAPLNARNQLVEYAALDAPLPYEAEEVEKVLAMIHIILENTTDAEFDASIRGALQTIENEEQRLFLAQQGSAVHVTREELINVTLPGTAERVMGGEQSPSVIVVRNIVNWCLMNGAEFQRDIFANTDGNADTKARNIKIFKAVFLNKKMKPVPALVAGAGSCLLNFFSFGGFTLWHIFTCATPEDWMVNTCCGCFNLVDVALRAALRIPVAFICTGEESTTSSNAASAEEQVDAPAASASATPMRASANADVVLAAHRVSQTQRGSAARRVQDSRV